MSERSANYLAVRAIVRRAPMHQQAELLDMLGVVDELGDITPDDTARYTLPRAEPASGLKDSHPLGPIAFADHGRRPEGMTTPPGLANLTPLEQQPAPKPKPKPVKPAPKPRVKKGRTPKPKKGRRQAVCGTTGGWSRHCRLKEVPCVPCHDAKKAYWRERDARLRAAAGRVRSERKSTAVCGTRSGYARHLREGTTTCGPCRRADNWRNRLIGRAA